ncbi:MAG: hypothetical protein R8L58_07000 [Mariprofundaceae bacterium]
MRFILLLIFALLLSIALIAFPDIADQALRLEAFGWVFETRQGAFIVALLALLFVIWLVRALLSALFAGPGHLWRSLRMGSRKRREQNLREALAQWLDMRGDMGVRTLKRSRGVIPDWLLSMLKVLMTPAKDQAMPSSEQDPLLTSLTARIVTGPTAHPKPDLATRKAHLDAWLAAHPGAPLAMARMADLAEEEEDWPKLVALLEDVWKRGHRSSHAVKPRLVHAYLQMAKLEPDAAMQYLRKAHRLMPDNKQVLQAYGQSLVAGGDRKAAIRLWRSHLEQESDLDLARLLLAELREDPLGTYRKLERASDAALNEAQRWLRAELAHAAKLDGLAFEQMQNLADHAKADDIVSAAWQSMGDWYLGTNEHGQAAMCYRKALTHGGAKSAEEKLDNVEEVD